MEGFNLFSQGFNFTWQDNSDAMIMLFCAVCTMLALFFLFVDSQAYEYQQLKLEESMRKIEEGKSRANAPVESNRSLSSVSSSNFRDDGHQNKTKIFTKHKNLLMNDKFNQPTNILTAAINNQIISENKVNNNLKIVTEHETKSPENMRKSSYLRSKNKPNTTPVSPLAYGVEKGESKPAKLDRPSAEEAQHPKIKFSENNPVNASIKNSVRFTPTHSLNFQQQNLQVRCKSAMTEPLTRDFQMDQGMYRTKSHTFGDNSSVTNVCNLFNGTSMTIKQIESQNEKDQKNSTIFYPVAGPLLDQNVSMLSTTNCKSKSKNTVRDRKTSFCSHPNFQTRGKIVEDDTISLDSTKSTLGFTLPEKANAYSHSQDRHPYLRNNHLTEPHHSQIQNSEILNSNDEDFDTTSLAYSEGSISSHIFNWYESRLSSGRNSRNQNDLNMVEDIDWGLLSHTF